MKKAVGFYLLGVVSVLGLAYHAGSDAIIQCGLKLEAVQTRYAYDARPVLPVDEQMMVAELAKPLPTKRTKR